MASHGLFFSQRVLLALVEEAGLARRQAYEEVQRLAMQSWEERLSFPDLVRGDPFVTGRLSASTLNSLFAPDSYLQYEDVIFRRVFT
jgi:adenylosuccinate lyase